MWHLVRPPKGKVKIKEWELQSQVFWQDLEECEHKTEVGISRTFRGRESGASRSQGFFRPPSVVSLRLQQAPPNVCSAHPLVAQISTTACCPDFSALDSVVYCSKLGDLAGAPKARSKAMRGQLDRPGVKAEGPSLTHRHGLKRATKSTPYPQCHDQYYRFAFGTDL